MILILPALSFGADVKTKDEKKQFADPDVAYLSTGSFLDDNYSRYRVILNVFDVYTVLIIQKVTGGNEDQKGKVVWSRIVEFDMDNKFINPNDFAKSFKWQTTSSFSFENKKIKYELTDIGSRKPRLKEIK